MDQAIADANKHPNNVQGVTRLLDATQLQEALLLLRPQSYIIVTEKINTPEEHTHFLISGYDRSINVSYVKIKLKQFIKDSNLEPHEYLNGMLNITRVRDTPRMITYLLKENMPNHYHGYYKETIKYFKTQSFEKRPSMTVQIGHLKESYYHGKLNLQEYILQYRQIRNFHKKPDLNWMQDAKRVTEITKSEDTMIFEINQFIENLDRPYC